MDLLKTTLEPKAEVFGEYSAEVAETLKLIGSVQLAQGESGKALKTLKKVCSAATRFCLVCAGEQPCGVIDRRVVVVVGSCGHSLLRPAALLAGTPPQMHCT